jgi:hypothetical protein
VTVNSSHIRQVVAAPQSKATKIHNLSEPRFRFATELERAGNLNERGLP